MKFVLFFTFSPAFASSEFATFFNFFFTLVGSRGESKNLASGVSGGRSMCVRGAGNGNGTVSG